MNAPTPLERTGLTYAIAGVIADACADANDEIAWAAERSTQIPTAQRITDELFDPELADAEKRGAATALRYVADYWEARIGFGPIPDTGLDDAKQQEVVAAAAQGLRESARRIESGEVTLP